MRKVVGNCAVYCRHRSLYNLLGNSVEGLHQFRYKHPNARQQDVHIYREMEAGGNDVGEHQGIGCKSRIVLHQRFTSNNCHDSAQENGHQQRCGYHVVIEDGQEARKLGIFYLLLILTAKHACNLIYKPDAQHLLMADSKACVACQTLCRLYSQVRTDCSPGSCQDAEQNTEAQILSLRSHHVGEPENSCGVPLKCMSRYI